MLQEPREHFPHDQFPHTLDMDEFTHVIPPHGDKPPVRAAAEARLARRVLGKDVSLLILFLGVLAPLVFMALFVLADVKDVAPILH